MSTTAATDIVDGPATPQMLLGRLLGSMRGRHNLRVETVDGTVLVGKFMAARPSDTDDVLRVRDMDTGDEAVITVDDLVDVTWSDRVPF